MAVEISVGRRSYEGNNQQHAEEVMFGSGRYEAGDFAAEMNAWPCTGERHHDCHALFTRKSAGRTITLTVTGDKGGYAKNHDLDFGATGTIVYADGTTTITADT